MMKKEYKSVQEFMEEPIPRRIVLKVRIQLMIINAIYNIKHNIKIWYCSQFGFMIVWGKNYEKRPYISIEIPFLMVQIFLKK